MHLYTLEFTFQGRPYALPCAFLWCLIRTVRRMKASPDHTITGILIDGVRQHKSEVAA